MVVPGTTRGGFGDTMFPLKNLLLATVVFFFYKKKKSILTKSVHCSPVKGAECVGQLHSLCLGKR